MRNLSSTIADERVEKIMRAPLSLVSESTSISMIRLLLEDHYCVLVTRRGDVAGIIARSDLLKVVSRKSNTTL